MGSVRAIWLFMAAFSAFCGVGILLVRTDEKESRWLGKLFPGVWICKHRWGRRAAAVLCFLLSALSVAAFLGRVK